ncbi:hypothetical protein [Halorubrum gandharaense]
MRAARVPRAASRTVFRNPRPEPAGALEVFAVVLTAPTAYQEPAGTLPVVVSALAVAFSTPTI